MGRAMTGDGVETLSPSLPADMERLVEGVVREACLRESLQMLMEAMGGPPA